MMHLAHADPPPVSVILLWSWSRFARDQDDAHFWKASLRRHGIEIRDVSGETPQVQGFEYVLESLIHWKDAQKLIEVSHDARRGQQALARMGYIPSGCQPPRGYRVDYEERAIEGRSRRLRRWVPDPATWGLAKRAWELRLSGASYQTILRETRLYRSVGCLSTFFGNTAYQGYVTFGDTRIAVEPMVTPEEWQRVNAGRTGRRGGAYARQLNSRYVLSGLLRCARCGAAVCGSSVPAHHARDGYDRAEWRYYVCTHRRANGRCDLPRLPADSLEQAVLDLLTDQVLTPQNIATQQDALVHSQDSARAGVALAREAAARRLDELRRATDRLVDAIEQAADSAALVARLAQREAEVAIATAEIAELDARLAEAPPPPDVDAIVEALKTADPHLIRQLLAAIVVRVTVDVDSLRVEYRYPFATGLH